MTHLIAWRARRESTARARRLGSGRWPRRRLGAALLAAALIAGAPSAGRAETDRDDRTHLGAMFPEFDRRLQTLPPFVRDSAFTLHLRSFYQNVEKAPGEYQEAWAGGGWLAFESGWLADVFSVGAIVYTSQPLYAPADRTGTLLLLPNGDGFTVLGEAWAKLRLAEQTLTGYRQQVDHGYVNPYDGRMTPSTFEGAMLNGKLGWLEHSIGYLTRMKARDADDFVSLSEVAGASGTHEGAALAGVRVQPWQPLWVEANTVYAVDTFNTAFLQTEYTHALEDDAAISLGLQYTDQRSVGRALIGSFQTWTVGARLTLRAFGGSIEPSFHRTGSGNAVQTPFGRWPGYLKLITKDFDLARQTAAGVRLDYDLGRFGARGLTVRFAFAGGVDAINPKTRRGEPAVREYDFDVIYDRLGGWLRGLSFRVRVGLVEQSGISGVLPDIRLITNYELPVLRGAAARRLRAWWEKD